MITTNQTSGIAALLLGSPSLLERARGGDVLAFTQLIEEHQPALRRLCVSMLGDAEAAEDAVQETLIAAWKHIHSLRHESFKAWLMTIAANQCRSALRRRHRAAVWSLDASLEDGLAEPLDEARLPDEEALLEEMRDELESALRHLPPEQRQTVVLCDYHGLDYSETAREMNTTMGTVKSRLHRARRRLRRELAAAVASRS